MAPDRPRMRRGLRLLLIASLAFNLLILGAVGGALLQHRGEPGRRDAFGDIGFAPFIRALPSGDRDEVIDQLRDRSPSLRDTRDRLRAEFADLLTLLRADPFDADALAASVEHQQEQLGERQRIGREVLVQQIAGMSAEDRRAYADALEKGFRVPPEERNRPKR